MKAARAVLAAALTAGLMQGAAAAPFEDSMAQRLLACTGCHGAQGRAAADGYQPRIAGKPALYLQHQLQAFRDGRRPYGPMQRLLAPLSDAYLADIAGHFAALHLPYPAPQPASADAATLARGRALVEQGDAARQLPACTTCHGRDLAGVVPAIPGLLGLPRDYLNAQLGAWRAGQRRALAPDCMATVARRLADEDIAALSQWLASQPLPQPYQPAAQAAGPKPLPCGGVP